MKATEITKIWAENNLGVGDWDGLIKLYVENGYTVAVNGFKSLKHHAPSGVYTAVFDTSGRWGSRVVEIRVNNEVAKFILENQRLPTYYWFFSMANGVAIECEVTYHAQ